MAKRSLQIPDECPARNSKTRLLDGAAFLISVVLSPYLVTLLLILIVSFVYATTLKQFLPWILISLFFIGIIPVGYILWLLENKRVSDIYLSNHKERKIPFLIIAVSAVVGVIILYFLEAAKPILAIASAHAINAVLAWAITLYWKISIHSALFAASVIICMILFGAKLWPLFLLWVPLAGARVYREEHTPGQVLTGAVIAIVVTVIVLNLFGYKIGD